MAVHTGLKRDTQSVSTLDWTWVFQPGRWQAWRSHKMFDTRILGEDVLGH